MERLTLTAQAAIQRLQKDKENNVELGCPLSWHQKYLYHPDETFVLPVLTKISPAEPARLPRPRRCSTQLLWAEQPAGKAARAAEALQSKYLQHFQPVHLQKPPHLPPAFSLLQEVCYHRVQLSASQDNSQPGVNLPALAFRLRPTRVCVGPLLA